MPAAVKPVLPVVSIERHIHIVRGRKVMLDSDLASLYAVPTKSLNLSVQRNRRRFPEDFMFRLTKEEDDALRLQIETSKTGRGGRRYAPYVFTELGVAMLSSVLNNDRAVQVNITIMRAFVQLRYITAHNKDIAERVEKLERGHERVASVIEILVEDIDGVAKDVKRMKALPAPRKRKIGFDI
jgi:hypothetical protein